MKTQVVRQNELEISPTVLSRFPGFIIAFLLPFLCAGQGRSVTLSGKAYDVIDTIFFDKKTTGDFVVVLYTKEAPGIPLIAYSYKGKISYYSDAVLTCRHCFGKVGTKVATLHGYSLNNRTICFRQDIFGRHDSISVDFSSDTPCYSKLVIHHWARPEKVPHNITEKGSVELTPRNKKTRLDAFSPPIDLEDPETKRLFREKRIQWRRID